MLKPTEVAARLGVTRQTVYNIIARDPTFPKPIYLTPKIPRWRVDDLERWLERKAAA